MKAVYVKFKEWPKKFGRFRIVTVWQENLRARITAGWHGGETWLTFLTHSSRDPRWILSLGYCLCGVSLVSSCLDVFSPGKGEVL